MSAIKIELSVSGARLALVLKRGSIPRPPGLPADGLHAGARSSDQPERS